MAPERVVPGAQEPGGGNSLAPERVVPGAQEPGGGSSDRPTTKSRSSQTAACSSSSPEPPHAATSCMETVQRFARHLGLSRGVARHLSLCRRSSLRRLFQHCWACYRHWCSEKGHSISPAVSKIVDFLLFLRMEKCLYVPTICGYRSALFAVFKFCLPGLQDSFILHDLIHSFKLERMLCPVSPPAWDLVKVLSFFTRSYL